MKSSAVNHHKTHKPPRWCGSWWATAEVPLLGLRPGVTVTEAPRAHRPRRRFPLAPSASLNCSLRRYVLASSLRVWLIRQAARAGCANALAVGNDPLRASGRQAGARSPMLREEARGVSQPRGSALRYRASRNRQMEHLVQVAVNVRGGVRRGSAITLRECTHAGGPKLITLSSKACA
jgi:hypothetical protein